VKRSLSLLLIAASATAALGDWPGWRGDGTGVAVGKSFPMEWSASRNIRWKSEVPGFGWSCPVVANGRVFVTAADFTEQKAPVAKGPPSGVAAPEAVIRRVVLCYDAATGKMLWEQTAAERKPGHGNHPSNTWATETPVTDGERVYAYFGNVGIFCYDFTGKPAWSRDLGDYKTFGNWGTSASPALDDGRIFIVCDNEEQSFVVALDAKTGRELWRERRDERSTWSTPIVWRNTQRTELVVMGSRYIRGYDPATGRELWRLASENSMVGRGGGGPPPPGGRTRPPGAAESASQDSKSTPPSPVGRGRSGGGGKGGSGGCKASPVAGPEMLYCGMSTKKSSGDLGPMWAVRAGALGDISLRDGQTSNKDVAWFRDNAGSHFTSPLLWKGLLYCFPAHAGEPLSCFDAKTGATIYQEPLPGHRGFMASPVAGEGGILCTDLAGTSYLVETGKQFKILARNELAELTESSPALSDGAIFLRTVRHLYCIGR
jgi:outer membrane protein assembly factor BamB